MYLRSLFYHNFRNLKSHTLQFENNPIIIWGENGQGKSNLLEAIALGCSGSPWRSGREEEVIAWGENVARVKARVSKAQEEEIETEAAVGREARPQFKINGVKRNRADLLGLIPVVGFYSEDLQTIKGEPTKRRAFLNREIAQVSRSYYWNLRHYRRVLEQRNRQLKELREKGGPPESVVPWEEGLAKHGSKVVAERGKFVASLQETSQRHMKNLHPGWGDLALRYRPALGAAAEDLRTPGRIETLESALIEAFAKNRSEEIARGYSLVGPQRDDVEILLDDIDQRVYGSQGQQRSVAIALRLGVSDIIRESGGEEPLFLLDDIFSELDEKRREGILQTLGAEQQFFVTMPTLAELPDTMLAKRQLYRVAAGEVEPYETKD